MRSIFFKFLLGPSRFHWLGCCSLFLIGCATEPATLFEHAIVNGKVIDLETGELLDKDVFISDGRIKVLADRGLPADFKARDTIDAEGKFILPGFWDNHVHFRGGDSLVDANANFLKLFIANGITTVRDAGGDLTPSVMTWKDQIENGERVGPTIFTSGPKIDGPDATWAGSLEVSSDAEVIAALDSLERISVDFVKLYDSRISGEHYLNTIRKAEKRNLITSGHMPFTVTLEETVDAGIDAIEHLYYVMKGCSSKEDEITQSLQKGEIGFWEAMPALQRTYTDSVAQKTFDLLKENNVYVVPTLHIGKILSYLDEIDHSGDPYLRYMGDGIIATYQGRIQSAMNASEDARENRKALDRFFGTLARSLNEAGVPLLAGSDSGAFNSYTYPGTSLHGELQEMVANGVSPLDALRSSTPNGVKFLKKDADYGSISVGKVSDLVILEDNPLKNIQNTQKIHAVIKGDSIFDKPALQRLLKNAMMH